MHQFTEKGDISLRLFTRESYHRVRLMYQVIDVIALDFGHKQWDKRELVAAVIYFVIGGQQGMMVFPSDYEIAATCCS